MKKILFICCLLTIFVASELQTQADLINPSLLPDCRIILNKKKCEAGEQEVICYGKECKKYKNKRKYTLKSFSKCHRPGFMGGSSEDRGIYCKRPSVVSKLNLIKKK